MSARNMKELVTVVRVPGYSPYSSDSRYLVYMTEEGMQSLNYYLRYYLQRNEDDHTDNLAEAKDLLNNLREAQRGI